MTGQTWISSTQNTTMTQTNKGWVCVCAPASPRLLTDHSGPTLLLCWSVMILATELHRVYLNQRHMLLTERWTGSTASVTAHRVTTFTLVCDKVIKAVLLILCVHWNENDSRKCLKIKWKKQKTAQLRGLMLALSGETCMQKDFYNKSSRLLPGAAGRPQRRL